MITRRGQILSVVIVSLIVGTLIHHSIKHEGTFFENIDFADAVQYLTKSHEAIVLVLAVFLTGVITNDLRQSKKMLKKNQLALDTV